MWLLQVRELALEDGVRCEVASPPVEAFSDQLRIPFEIDKANISRAKLFAIGMLQR